MKRKIIDAMRIKVDSFLGIIEKLMNQLSEPLNKVNKGLSPNISQEKRRKNVQGRASSMKLSKRKGGLNTEERIFNHPRKGEPAGRQH